MVLEPLGWISNAGARHFAGSVKDARIRALPAVDSGTDGVVAAAVVSLPQNSAARTVVTGPGVPLPVGGGITRPRIRTSSRPSWRRRASPKLSTQGAPPAALLCSVGSPGTVGASVVSNSVLPRWSP